MRLIDINEELTEAPGDFGQRIKAKVQKHIPFNKATRERGAAKDEIFQLAKKLKNGLKLWADKSGLDKKDLSIEDFLRYMDSKNYGKYAKAVADKLHPGLAKAQDEEAQDDKAPEKAPAEKVSTEDEAKFRKQEADAARAEAKELESEHPKHDIRASKGDDKEPKVDTSASIYESFLTELTDNEIDTLIVRTIQSFHRANPGDSIDAEPTPEPKQEPTRKEKRATEKAEKKAATAEKFTARGDQAADDFLSEYQGELESILTKVKTGADLDKRDQRSASNMLNSL